MRACTVPSAGEGGYACFRIPAVVALPAAAGYAVFAEARNKSCSDYAPTDIVVKTSADGLSWGNMTVLCPLAGGTSIPEEDPPAPCCDSPQFRGAHSSVR